MNLMIAIVDFSMIMTAIALVAAPYWSRPGIFFGKTVPVGFAKTAEGRATLSRYRTGVSILAAIAITSGHLSMSHGYAWAFLASSAGLLIGTWICWVCAHRRVPPSMTAPPSTRTASLERRTSVPGGWLFALGPFMILALAGCVLYFKWDSIPERFPTHWGLNGQVDGWGTRTAGSLSTLLGLGAVQSLLMIVLAYFLMSRTRQIATIGTAAERESGFRRTSAVIMILIAYVMAIMFAVIGARPVWSSNGDRLDVALILLPIGTVIASIGLVGYLIYVHQRATMEAQPGTVPSGDGTPDACWKWGMIYYNPNDPALLVEKRAGIGWTFNFANKGSWMVMGLILLLAFIPLILGLLR